MEARPEDGRVDIAHQCVSQIDVEQSTLIVPVQAMVYDPQRQGGAEKPELTGNRVIQFHTTLRGPSTVIDFKVPLEPKQVWLDARSEVFGEFFSRRGNPKAMLYFQAVDLADAGSWEDAERRLHEALIADVGSGTSPGKEVDKQEIETRRIDLDARIQWELARVYLASRRLESANVANTAAKKLWRKLELRRSPFRPIKPKTVVILEARLELLKGNPRAALKLLDAHKTSSREWYLSYALATCALGRQSEFEEAVEQAEERGADVSLLESCY